MYAASSGQVVHVPLEACRDSSIGKQCKPDKQCVFALLESRLMLSADIQQPNISSSRDGAIQTLVLDEELQLPREQT